MSAGPTLAVASDDPTPPYEQLRRQLCDLIRTGHLRSGERLPPVRQLATDLGVAAGTVARTYRELDAGGWVVTRRGGGTQVDDRWRALDGDGHPTALADLAARTVAEARVLGVDADQLHAAIDTAWATAGSEGP